MKFEPGERVITPDGPGTITGIDLPGSRAERFIVELDVPKYDFTPAYWEKDIRKEEA